MRVLIVGAGMAGLTLASRLRLLGAECRIVEVEPEWNRRGYSLGLWHNGRRVLQRLGLGDRFDQMGHSSRAFLFAGRGGVVLRRYDFRDMGFSPAHTQITRQDLHDLLLSAAEPVPISMGTTLDSLAQDEQRVTVTLSDGSSDSYDLVVGADGVHSMVRRLLFGGGGLGFEHWRGWFFWTRTSLCVSGEDVYEMCAPGMFFGTFPHGKEQACAFVARPCPPDEPDSEGTRRERLQGHFLPYGGPAARIVQQLPEASTLVKIDLATVHLPRWHQGRVVLVGDAAHAMVPFAGMGSSMAMEDAVVLAEEVARRPAAEVPGALGRYAARRMPRVLLARQQTSLLWNWVKVESPSLAFARDAATRVVPSALFTRGYRRMFAGS